MFYFLLFLSLQLGKINMAINIFYNVKLIRKYDTFALATSHHNLFHEIIKIILPDNNKNKGNT